MSEILEADDILDALGLGYNNAVISYPYAVPSDADSSGYLFTNSEYDIIDCDVTTCLTNEVVPYYKGFLFSTGGKNLTVYFASGSPGFEAGTISFRVRMLRKKEVTV